MGLVELFCSLIMIILNLILMLIIFGTIVAIYIGYRFLVECAKEHDTTVIKFIIDLMRGEI